MNTPDLSITLIGAMTKDRVIGRDDGMPWDIPEEYRTFVETIRGETVIMGRRSYEIFGGDLTSAHTVILSRGNPEIEPPVASGPDDALLLARSYGKKIFVSGGAQTYELFLPLADWIYLSEIKGDYTGDKYFPKFDPSQWEITREDDHERFIYRQWRRLN